jgi:predicted dehydrogenase
LRSREAELVVVGAGAMAREHVRAAIAIGLDPDAIVVAARRRERAGALARELGIHAAGLEEAAGHLAIVAVSEPALADVAAAQLERGADRVLVEKPGALTVSELEPLARFAGRAFVAYNRRFYASVERARTLIEDDGGPLAVTFDFTEIEDRVLDDARRRGLDSSVLARWGVANSLHVIDLAFYLAGAPGDIACERAGSLSWHPAGARFAGSGSTERGALFSYAATWDGAGRWSVEVTTRARRLVLRPLEELHEQRRGSFALEPVAVPTEPEGVKPGLAGQLEAFLGGRDEHLCGIEEAAARIELAERMLGYA